MPDPPKDIQCNNALDEVMASLRKLEDLNPDLSGRELERLDALAHACNGDGDFDTVAEQVRKLVDLYLGTPTIQVGKEILKEYFHALEQTAGRLLASGEIAALPQNGDREDGSFSKALVLYSTFDYGAVDRCKILSQAQIPETLTRAADAFRRRVDVVDAAFGIGFRILRQMDDARFQVWAAGYLEENKGALAPEVIRDLLWELRASDNVTPQLREWLFRWCGDEALLEDWPLVVRHADRLADRLFLKRWAEGCKRPRNASLAHLKLLVSTGQVGDERLLAWIENTLLNFGSSIERFISLDREIAPEDEEWAHGALVAELRNLEATYQPIIALSDHLLAAPDGAAKLAMAFLGVVGQGLKEWEEAVMNLSEKVIRRSFLVDLKEGRTPLETIRQFTFGDPIAFALISNELDLLTQQFDSIAQREVVVKKLAIYYASYRRAPMLGQEVARRYRHFARILHEDFLATHLTPEELEGFQKTGFLQELYSMGSRAKRFLDHRRALEMSVEEMVASQIEFVAETRIRRLGTLRRILS